MFYRDGSAWLGPWLVGFHQSESGHYLQLRREGTLTIGPLDSSQLARHVEELIAEGAGTPLREADHRR
ncbi:MAG: hypothetical protein JO100_17780 [Pseudonocardia sp.]|nr:hypothetical protein [Pseudonocardia sp.]